MENHSSMTGWQKLVFSSSIPEEGWTFMVRTITEWNAIDPSIKKASIPSFKPTLYQWFCYNETNSYYESFCEKSGVPVQN